MPDYFECENVYEKWLRRRLNYACIRETGRLCPPQMVHQIVHQGSSCDDITRNLTHTMWDCTRYPQTHYFEGCSPSYKFPREINEIVDLRFYNAANMPTNAQISVDSATSQNNNCDRAPLPSAGDRGSNFEPRRRYQLSMKELLSVPSWGNDTRALVSCPYHHQLEHPQSWRTSCEQIEDTSGSYYNNVIDNDKQLHCHSSSNPCCLSLCGAP